MDKSYYKSPKASRLMKLLWNAAGADAHILNKSTYSDHVKYACLGGIVVATGLMAAMAGGYAFYIIFGQQVESLNGLDNVVTETSSELYTILASLLFGTIWGLIIFNIDRFIVASTGKGDGTEAITASEIKTAIPRILMGIIIAITISKPVELRMFQTEIEVELDNRRTDALNRKIESFRNLFEPKIEEYKSEQIEINKTTKEAMDRWLESKVQFDSEMTGEGGTGTIGYGPEAERMEIAMNNFKKDYDSLRILNNENIQRLNLKINEQDSLWSLRIKAANVSANSLNGLMERLQIVDLLAKGKDEDGNPNEDAIPWITIFITLLFMAIELTPIFFKMMLIKSPYDYMEDNIKALQKADLGIEEKYEYFDEKEGVQRNLIIHHQSKKLLAEKIKILQTQTELNDLIIEKWKEDEKKHISKNPQDYIERG